MIAALLFAINSFAAGPMRPPKGFAGQVYAGTFVLYDEYENKLQMLCTAAAYESTPGGYHLLTAGHCIQETPAEVALFVSEEIGGTLMPVTVVKSFVGNGIDFATLELRTPRKYPMFSLGDERDLRIGDATLMVAFSEGVVKQFGYGTVASEPFVESPECNVDCSGYLFVQTYGSGGASGALIFSAKTHKVVGIFRAMFTSRVGTTGAVVEPISKFTTFRGLPGQTRPSMSDLRDPEDDDPAVTEPKK